MGENIGPRDRTHIGESQRRLLPGVVHLMGQALESTRLIVEGALALADVTNGTFMSAQTVPCTENIRSINIIAVDIEFPAIKSQQMTSTLISHELIKVQV
jgi:hypothetical protein